MISMPVMLITDDDVDFRQTLDELFVRRGFKTLQAEDGSQAVEIVQSEEIHVVLLDMHMPRLDGLSTLRVVKKIKQSLPCIMISADADEQVRRDAESADVYSFLDKPISCNDITTVVERAMHQFYQWTGYSAG